MVDRSVRWVRDGHRPPVIAVAVHSGHALSPEAAEIIALDDLERRYEEDPGTDRLTEVAPVRAIGLRSRFEIDLNRPPDEAFYQDADAAWGLEVWERLPPEELKERSLSIHGDFYNRLGMEVDEMIDRNDGVVVLDCHAYNHRRAGNSGAPEDNPDVNVGTGSMDRERWGDLVDRFKRDLGAAGDLDVRENVRFQGREVPAFIHRNFDDACCLAVEFKKTYMDEYTGEIDDDQLARRVEALHETIPGMVEELERIVA